MWWPQGKDDGSVLKYVTKDEPQRAPQIAHYTEPQIARYTETDYQLSASTLKVRSEHKPSRSGLESV